jgi:large subunit ribosomal protein L4
MQLKVLNTKGAETKKTVTLSDEIFGIEPNDHAIYLDVRHYLDNQRQGTHKSKERAEVAGSTKKIKKQKGTGGARAGSLKSPVFVGGGRVFGPRPKDYGFKLNKKVKVLARASAFAYKLKEDNLAVVEEFSFAAPKTKEYLTVLDNLAVSDVKSLILLGSANDNVYLSSRNVSYSRVLLVDQVTTYDILNSDKVILSEEAVTKLEQILS